MVTRRRILRGLGIGAGIAVAVPVTRGIQRGHEVMNEGPPPYAGSHRETPAPAVLDAAVAEFLGPIAPGAVIDRWSVRAVRGVHLGAVVVLLETETGSAFQVDVLRHDPGTAAA